MRTITLAAAVTLASTASFAGVLDARFGNTLIVVDAGGDETHLYYAADGTLTGKQGDQSFKGTWTLEGTQLCVVFVPELSMPNPQCGPVTAHNVGETWSAGDATAKLAAGIQ